MDSPSQEAEKQPLDQQIEESSTSNEDTANTDDSSTSETPDEELSTLELVQKAVGGDDEGDQSEEDDSEEDDQSEGKTEESEDSEGEADDEPTEEELKAWKPKTKQRFEQLQSKYREEKSLREAAEVKAGQFDQFTNFLDTNRITQEEANELFDIGALMKNDPAKALQLLEPHYRNLLAMTGNVLPPELQQQVQQGYITEQHARELSQLKASKNTQGVIEQERVQHQQMQEQVRQQELHNQVTNTMSTWEKNWASTDPDYNVKKTKVLDRVELELTRAARNNTLPKTVEEAVRLAEKAKSDVEAEFRQYRPKKPVNTVNGNGATSVKREPTSTLDVIQQALGQ